MYFSSLATTYITVQARLIFRNYSLFYRQRSYIGYIFFRTYNAAIAVVYRAFHFRYHHHFSSFATTVPVDLPRHFSVFRFSRQMIGFIIPSSLIGSTLTREGSMRQCTQSGAYNKSGEYSLTILFQLSTEASDSKRFMYFISIVYGSSSVILK